MDRGRLFQLTDNQMFPNGETILNVYFYATDGIGGTAEDLCSAFSSGVLLNIRDMQSAQFKHTSLQAHNLENAADFFELPLSNVFGTVAGEDCLPAFVAVNYTLRAATRDVRPGSKRIGGLPDGAAYYTNGVMTHVGMIAWAEQIRLDLGATLVRGGVDYVPVIVKRVLLPADAEHGKRYVLPRNDAETTFYPVEGVNVNARLTHQTSRGNGR